MTPNTPAGGAVQIGELVGYGRISGDAIVRMAADLPPGTPLYTQPPATVPADAVLALVGKWIGDSERVQKQRKHVSQARGAYCQALLLCADELEALTRGGK